MKLAEFAERQYETTFHLELGYGGGGPFVPTQRLERYLGIDAATDAQTFHRIWRILNVNIPRRIYLSPNLWPALPQKYLSAISGRVVSLFIQFKIPKHQDGMRAKYRKAFGVPYYEVGINQNQQKTLADLQRRVQSRAVVRYASPAFWKRAEFDDFAIRRQVLAQSAYLIPSRAGSHKKWMYAGPTGKVLLNPEPEELDTETWESLISLLEEQSQEESVRAHISALAQSIRETREATFSQPDNAGWLAAIREYTRLSADDAHYLIDLRTVADYAEQADTTWTVLLSPNEGVRDLLNKIQKDFGFLF